MPSGLPHPSALSSRKACAFSLDTSVIEEAAFRFNDGPLKQLSRQLPPWLELWMPDIVAREISQHRIEHVSRSVQQINTGMQDLRRHIGKAFDQTEPDWLRAAKDTAVHVFDEQLQRFLKSHNGLMLEPNHQRLGTEIFNLYFQGRPPFGGGKDKKHEFPDGASLLMLDFTAAERGVHVVAVSKDDGWKAYAERSAHVYCVSSLQDLTAMFMSHSPEAKAIQKRLGEAFAPPSADLKRSVKAAIEIGLKSLPWRIKLPRLFRFEFDAVVVETKLKLFELRPDEIGVWITSPKNDACVAEMPVDVEVSLRVEVIAYRYDGRGEKIDVLDAQAIVDQQFEVKLQLEMDGALQIAAPEELIKNMSLGDSPIDVIVGRNELGPDWLGKLDEFDEDIPF